ncbi:ABC-2 type transport system permease protein [Bacteroides reticulotermitis]|uniref:ABC-2 type transport system permease protein n=1 Tax=Bacteroides reticulotermitis TaxID=1133319 RepID=A0A840CZH1_9BACE|nr:Gldg family protein [Bacteroides reticulotermitis]MBB4043518.1 ABC-2 type transport system permease protein [Bacteroides reticulotermitis]
MKKIYKIAKAELLTMFYSPVAWLILIVFTIQIGISFVASLKDVTNTQNMGYTAGSLTPYLLINAVTGLFTMMQKYLYLYMPLLTMGLMSREYSSGTIKLLYSSPVTAKDIIFGKFLGMISYGAILLAALLVLVLGFAFTVDNFNYAELCSGLLGMFLLLCAYSAIGLFVSSLTSYQVVAAIGTLVVLAVLNYANQLWQDIAFVREITYWICLTGRSGPMTGGLICSEDVIYYFVVIAMFLLLSILKLQSTRQSEPVAKVIGKYAFLLAGVVVVGYITSRPVFMYYYDTTETKRNTLSISSQEVMSKLDGGLTITTYVNMLDDNRYLAMPANIKEDEERFKQYLRFKPDMTLKYVYYYADSGNDRFTRLYPGLSTKEMMEKEAELAEVSPELFMPVEELNKTIDLSGEGYHFVRVIERENGQTAFLRLYNDMMKVPGESEISVAFKRFTTKLPVVGFLTGQGEPRITGEGLSRDYTMFADTKDFRQSLVNQGFDVLPVSVSDDQDIPANIDIIVIADMNRALTEGEQEKLDKYIARGGNMLIAGRARKDEVMNSLVEQFGVKFLPGTLVQKHVDEGPNVVYMSATPEMQQLSYLMEPLGPPRNAKIVMADASGLEYTTDKGYHVEVVLRSDSVGCWNETETIDFVNDSVVCNPAAGEVERCFPTGLALTRKVGDKEQRILVLSDATAISNGELSGRRRIYNVLNYTLITGGFSWFSYGEAPIDIRRPLPTDLYSALTRDDMVYVKALTFGILPGLMLLLALILGIRRQRK